MDTLDVAAKRGGNDLNGFKDFRIENVSRQDRHPAFSAAFRDKRREWNVSAKLEPLLR